MVDIIISVKVSIKITFYQCGVFFGFYVHILANRQTLYYFAYLLRL